MSLLDTINANTEQVRNGKNNVASAIASKGGSVISSGIVPTFNEFFVGVNFIDTSGGGGGSEPSEPEIIVETVYSAGNGAIDMTATAAEEISKYDSIKVLANTSGDVSYAGYGVLPAVGRIDKTESTYAEETLDYSKGTQGATTAATERAKTTPHLFYQSAYNTIICVGTTASNYHYFPFYLKGGEYVQLKINGSYNTFPEYFASGTATGNLLDGSYCQSLVAYDNDNKLLFVGGWYCTAYKLDEENLNLIPLTSVSGKCLGLWAYKSHVFYHYGDSLAYLYMRKFDETTNTFGSEIKLSNYYYNFNSRPVLVDLIPYGNDSIYVLLAKHDGQGPTITKLTLDATGTFATAIKSQSFFSTTKSKPVYCGLPDAYRAFFTNTSGTFSCWHITDTGTSFQFAVEDVTALFLDDTSVFDPSTITQFVLDKAGYMYAYNGTGWYLLKTEYNEAGVMLGYQLVTQINTEFTPTVSSFPIGTRFNLNFPNGYFIKSSTGDVLLYKEVVDGGAYLIQRTNNKISNEDNLYGYGIAKENIASGEEGTVSLGLLK